jgi:hypothetical protein
MALPTTTTQNDVITDLVDALIVLQATTLAGVTVSSAPLELSQVPGDQIAVLNIFDGDESWEGLGNHKRMESYTIDMACVTFESGADETAIRASRDRAYTIHNVVADYIRQNPHFGGTTIAKMSGTNLAQGFEAQTRWTRLDWGIRVENAQIEVI